jgi:phosphoglycolate phosphatase
LTGKTAIFDLDGTLADTSADLLAAANACFRGLGRGDLLGQGDALTAFAGGRAMLRLGFSRLGPGWTENHVDEQYPVLLSAYAQDIDRHTTLYPGVMTALLWLNAAGWRCGICTNKPVGLAEELVARLGIRGQFDSLIGADSLPVRKPDPAPYLKAVRLAGGSLERSLLIGDTVTDRDTARAAGVPVVLVTFGPGGRSVADLAPDALLDHFDDLPALADRLLR